MALLNMIASTINQFTALVAMIPAVYAISADPARYAADFYDVTVGNNQADPSVPGYPATSGWDPVTGVGTPNAAVLVPDLVAAANGH